jgi:hypothetical protein
MTCGHVVISEEIQIPSPNHQADTSSESRTEKEGYAVCENCEKQYDISIFSTILGGDGNITELPVNHFVEVFEIPEPYYQEQYEAISSNTQSFQTFEREIEGLKELNQILIPKPSTDKSLRRQIYIGVIASMEIYLSDAFINTTLNSVEFTKMFVSTFHEFKSKSFFLSDIFKHHDEIEKTCRQAMLDVIYHNLPKVKGMYKDTLNIDIGNIANAYKAVLNRHDLVHRNGKTKEGNQVIVSKDIIDQLF